MEFVQAHQPPTNALKWQWQQTMLRIKDPEVTIPFYKENFGMTLIAVLKFEEWKFNLYFLTTLVEGEEYTLDPESQEAADYLWNGKYNGQFGSTLELTYNYGTEKIDGPVYHPGNQEKDGFGHVAFNVPDVQSVCDDLVSKGVQFKKLPHEGRMKGLAFAYDPDNYWIEICSRGKEKPAFGNTFNLSQTMIRVKDPQKSIDFFRACGMTLLYFFNGGSFSNYFMASLAGDDLIEYEKNVLPFKDDPEKFKNACRSFMSRLFIPVLELTHNHGTETDKSFQHNTGNDKREGYADGRGYGHIGFLVDDLDSAVAELEPLGYGFKKRPEDGNMNQIAFAYDPDNYWVEIIKRGFN